MAGAGENIGRVHETRGLCQEYSRGNTSAVPA